MKKDEYEKLKKDKDNNKQGDKPVIINTEAILPSEKKKPAPADTTKTN